MEFCSTLCDGLDGRGVWGRMDTCICMAESPCCSPKTITTSLINSTQYKMKIKKKELLSSLTPFRGMRPHGPPSPFDTLHSSLPLVFYMQEQPT